jgi:hypothetical protein
MNTDWEEVDPEDPLDGIFDEEAKRRIEQYYQLLMSDDKLRSALVAIVRECSPSALPEARADCITHAQLKGALSRHGGQKWWDEYPLGHLTRLAYRLFALCEEFEIDTNTWTATWDIPGEELPPLKLP